MATFFEEKAHADNVLRHIIATVAKPEELGLGLSILKSAGSTKIDSSPRSLDGAPLLFSS